MYTFLRNYGEILCDNDCFILFYASLFKTIFFMRMHVFPLFYGILRNSAEFAFIGRFLMRMHFLDF